MSELPAMTIITGAPGTGKTTISTVLARTWQEKGGNVLKLDTDVFFSFPQAVIPPDQPDAKTQNETISKVAALSAITFAEAGYNVIIDGAIGPWILPHYLKVFKGRLQGLSYVVLRAPLQTTLDRAAQREDGDKFQPAGVKNMHAQFADLKVFEPHAYETENLSSERTVKDLDLKICNRDFQFVIGK